MSKTLHLFMLLTLLIMGGISVNAEEVTIDLTAQGFNNQDKVTTVKSDPITLTFDKAKGGTAPAYYTKSPSGVRLYGSNTLKVDAGAGNTISKVVFTFTVKSKTTAADLKADQGTFDSNSKTWTGSVQSFTLTNTASSGNAGFTKIVVTYSSAAEPGKTATNVTFEKGDYTVKQDANATDFLSYTNAATVTDADGNAISGATVTYSSSDKDHADVDANGTVTIDQTAAGIYTITATYAGDETHSTSSATYTITVQEDLGLKGAGTEDDPYTVADALTILNKKKETEFGKSVYVKGIISRVVSTTPHKTYGSLNYDISDDGQDENYLYVYGGLKKDAAKFTSASEIAAGDIVLLKGDLLTYGKQNTPELNTNNTLEKFYEREMVFDEDSNFDVKACHNVKVTLGRKFNADAWNTLVLPFDLTAEQATTTFGANVKLAKYTGTKTNDDGTYTLNFETTNSIVANEPVFVYGANSDELYEISGLTVKEGTPSVAPENAAFTFEGTYSNATAQSADWFISSDNNFYKAVGTEVIKPSRAVFRATTEASAAKGLSFNIDGETTGIAAITADGIVTESNAPIYNLAGQQVTKAYKGVVIQNGRKFIQK